MDYILKRCLLSVSIFSGSSKLLGKLKEVRLGSFLQLENILPESTILLEVCGDIIEAVGQNKITPLMLLYFSKPLMP